MAMKRVSEGLRSERLSVRMCRIKALPSWTGREVFRSLRSSSGAKAGVTNLSIRIYGVSYITAHKGTNSSPALYHLPRLLPDFADSTAILLPSPTAHLYCPSCLPHPPQPIDTAYPPLPKGQHAPPYYTHRTQHTHPYLIGSLAHTIQPQHTA